MKNEMSWFRVSFEGNVVGYVQANDARDVDTRKFVAIYGPGSYGVSLCKRKPSDAMLDGNNSNMQSGTCCN